MCRWARLCGAHIDAALLAIVGREVFLLDEGRQRGQVGIGAQEDMAAIAAIAAGRTALGHVLFAVPGHGAVSPLAGLYLNVSLVVEMHMGILA